MLECDIAYHRYVAVLYLMYEIWCNQMHPVCGALPRPYVPQRVTRRALVVHRNTYAPLRCRTSQYRMTFISLSVSLWNDLADPVSDGVGLAGFKRRANTFLLASAARSPFVFYCVLFRFFLFIGWYSWAGARLSTAPGLGVNKVESD